MGMRRVWLVVLFGVVLLAGRAAAGVLVVDPQGTGFTQISAAVLAAADGDVILVKAGAYGPVGINGKAVTIVAEVGAQVVVLGPINIFNLPAGKTVVLDRVNADANGVSPTHALLVINCAGAVRVQQGAYSSGPPTGAINSNCDVTGDSDGPHAVRVVDSSNVAFVACTMQGSEGSEIWDYECHIEEDTEMIGGRGGHGLELSGASVTVYTSTIRGGDSGDGGYSDDAGDGASVRDDSRLVVVGSGVFGGDGGESYDGIFPAPGGEGGHGIAVDASSEVRLLDDQVAGGVQGPGWGIPVGPAALAIDGDGLVTSWSGVAPSLGLFKLVREGQLLPIQVTGTPGDTVLLFMAPQTAAIPVQSAKGTFMLNPAPLFGPIVLGVIGGSGPLTFSATMPNLPAALLSAEVYLQAALSGPSGLTLSSWGHLTVLDASL